MTRLQKLLNEGLSFKQINERYKRIERLKRRLQERIIEREQNENIKRSNI